jgi:hypothetical protein
MDECVLDGLLGDDLLANACAFSTGPALRQFLAHRNEVQKVSAAFAVGSLTEDAIRAFVVKLLGDLKTGVHFGHDVTLAALAVALAEQRGPFVEEFLRELAELRVSEIPLAPRVAQEILKGRQARLESVASQPIALS